MPHSIIILTEKLNCLIALTEGELATILTTLRDDCEALNTFILESQSEQPEAHELLEQIQTWATTRCAAQNIGEGCEDEAKNFSEAIHRFI